jgi:hypothetical protein
VKTFKPDLLKEAADSVIARELAQRATGLTIESQRWLADELPQLVIKAYATYRALLNRLQLSPRRVSMSTFSDMQMKQKWVHSDLLAEAQREAFVN